MVQASTSRRLTLEVFRSCEVSSWTNINPNLEKKAGQMENNLNFWICFGEVCKLALNYCESSEDSWIKLSLVPNHWWLRYVLKPGHSHSHQRASAILQLMSFNLAICQGCIASWGVTCWERNTLCRMDFWTPRHVLWSNNKCQTTVIATSSYMKPTKNGTINEQPQQVVHVHAAVTWCQYSCSDSDVMASTCDSSNFAFHSSITPERSWMEAHCYDESLGFLGCKQADTKLLFADFWLLPSRISRTSRMWVSRLVFISRFILWEWAFQGFAFLLQLNFLLLHGKGKWTA